MVQWVNHYPWYQLLEVDPKKLAHIVRIWSPKKISPLLEKIKEGGEIDAPVVAKSIDGGIDFIDGIHRVAAAIQLGLPTIKISVSPEEKDSIEKFLKECL